MQRQNARKCAQVLGLRGRCSKWAISGSRYCEEHGGKTKRQADQARKNPPRTTANSTPSKGTGSGHGNTYAMAVGYTHSGYPASPSAFAQPSAQPAAPVGYGNTPAFGGYGQAYASPQPGAYGAPGHVGYAYPASLPQASPGVAANPLYPGNQVNARPYYPGRK
ncbi:hypothetical protein HMN09_00830200 [Mycena chlorophos]|uniref:Uncharacterized protein n=1 Tax=Mycena chlorophos TaxID=658473 RepID=A0A8H6ST86_MYCCL|nr:hypothetical protein HMN09_00830200 [Mycena chlorophos]